MRPGFTKAWRKEIDSSIWNMPPIYHRVFVWLRHRAEWKETMHPTRRKYGIWLLPGQMLVSLSSVAAGVAWTEYGIEKKPNKKTIKDVLDWLEFKGAVTIESNDFGTFIFITNWGVYQGEDPHGSNDSCPAEKPEGNGKRTHPKKLKKLEEGKEEKKKTITSPPEGVSVKIWEAFRAHRKAKRAPITEIVLDGFRREAAKAHITLEDAFRECCERGWQGFKAEWYLSQNHANKKIHPPSKQGAAHLAMEEIERRFREQASMDRRDRDGRAQEARVVGAALLPPGGKP